MWFITKTRHREYVEDFARSWTNFMLDSLVEALLISENCDGEYTDIVTKRLAGKRILHELEVEQILAYNGVLDLTVSPDHYAKDFLKLVSSMEFNYLLRGSGLEMARETDGYGIVLQPITS